MLSIDVIAIGKLKNEPLLDVFEDYKKRLSEISPIEPRSAISPAEHAKIAEKLNPRAAPCRHGRAGKIAIQS